MTALSAFQRRKHVHEYAETLEDALHTAEIKSLGFQQAKNRSTRRRLRDTDDQAFFDLVAAKRYRKRLRTLRAEVPAPPVPIADLFGPTVASVGGVDQPPALEPTEPRGDAATRSPLQKSTNQPRRAAKAPRRTGPHRTDSWVFVAVAALLSATLLSGRLDLTSAWLATGLLLTALGLLLERRRFLQKSSSVGDRLHTYRVPLLTIGSVVGVISLLALIQPPPTNVNDAGNPTQGSSVDGAASSPSTTPSGSVGEAQAQAPASMPRSPELPPAERCGPSNCLRFLSPPGSAFRAVRFNDGQWMGINDDGSVPLPNNPARLVSSDGRLIVAFEAVMEHEAGIALVVQGDALLDTSTTLVVDHQVTPFHHGEPTPGAAVFNVAVAARSNASTPSSLLATINDGPSPRQLPAIIGLRDGTNVVDITHSTPGRLDDTNANFVVSNGVLFAAPATIVEVNLEPKHALSVVNHSGAQLSLDGRDFETPLLQAYVTENATTTVSSLTGVLWRGSIDTDAVLHIPGSSSRVSTSAGDVQRRTAVRDAEPACDETVATFFDTLFPLSAIAYPTGFFGRTGVVTDFAQGTGMVTRTGPLEVTVNDRDLDVTYECTFDATSSSVQALLITSNQLSVTRGQTPAISQADDATLSALGIDAVGTTEAAIETETRRTGISAQTTTGQYAIAESPPLSGLVPISLVPIGADAARLNVRDITLIIPVVEFATARFTSTDPEAVIVVEEEGGDVHSGLGTVDVRAPIGTELSASAQSDPATRYLPALPLVVRMVSDSVVSLVQKRQIEVQVGSNAPGALLRIPGVLEEPVALPTTLELVADTDYVIVIEPPDDQWFGRSDTMRFAEDTSVSQELVRAANVTFTSDPTGATIRVSGQDTSRTPATYRLPVGAEVTYTIVASPPNHKGFEGLLTISGDAEHSTYLERYTDAERQALAPPPAPTPPPTVAERQAPPPRPAATPAASERMFNSSSGRPAPQPGERIRATPGFVVAFIANELELTDLQCPQTPFAVVTCGVSYDGESMISSLVDALFDIYLQPSSREIRWQREPQSNAYIGAFRRPEGIYVVSTYGNVVSIGFMSQ